LIYVDSSVLLPLLIADAHTEKVGAWYSSLSATVVVSDFANLEVNAMLSRFCGWDGLQKARSRMLFWTSTPRAPIANG
jgi:hypothetical protein